MTKGPSPSPFSAPCAAWASRSERLRRGVLPFFPPRFWGLGDQGVRQESMSAYLTDTRGAHHKDQHDCVEDALGLRFQEATIRGILYAQHDCVENALELRF